MTTASQPDLRESTRGLAERELQNFVDGAWAAAGGATTHDVFDPASGERLTTFACSDAGDVDRAVRSARGAQPAWATRTPAARAAALLALADLCEEHLGELSALEALDAGKPITAARDEVPGAIDSIRFAAGAARALNGQASGGYVDDLTSIFLREPYGVIGGITPWNFPLLQAVAKIAPAVAVGNAIVIKPAEITPLATARFVELAAEVLPPGVVNLVLGTGPVAGDALARHPGVDLVSFTGSVDAGRIVGAAAAEGLKPSVLELGGNAPVIVFGDADLDAAIEGIASAGLYNAGQECMAATRLLVEKGRYDEVVSALADRASRQRLGDSLDEETQLGPLVSIAQRERVEGRLAGRSPGSEVVTGGARPDRPGYFLEPTVIANVDAAEELVTGETFGPVFTVQPFGDEDEAIALANGTVFGLASSVWTRDIGRALRVGTTLKAGTVWVNDHLNLGPEHPVTGYGHSGHGTENGEQGLLTLTRVKHLAISRARPT